MRRAWALLLCLPAMGLAWAQAPQAQDVVNWTFDEGQLDGWQCKSNTQMAAAAEAGRGRVLQGRITYGEFRFGWFTRNFAETDFTGTWAVGLDVRGDGRGGRLTLQLGRKSDPRPIYWANATDGVTLDFTGWRHVEFLLPNFLTDSPGRNRLDDLSRVVFLELFITGGDRQGLTDIAFDNLRAVPPTARQAALLAEVNAEAAKLSGSPALDGSNLLPNPGFELDLGGSGRPDLWTASTWGTAAVTAPEAKQAHGGTRAVSVTCTGDSQRGSWGLRVPLSPGPWRFSAWYRTEKLRAAPPRGVDARLTLTDATGRTIKTVHAYGGDTGGKWRQAQADFVAPAGAASASLDLFNTQATGTVWWDDVALVADVAALAALKREAEANMKALQQAREQLPVAQKAVAELKARAGKGDDWPLLLAVLDWALEDAGLAIEAELGKQARATLQDVLDYCARADEIIAAAGQAKHPAAVAPEADANPYCAQLNKEIVGLAQPVPGYQKGEAGYAQIPNAWTFRTLGEQCAVLAWGLLNPRSVARHDPLLLRRLLVHWQAITQDHQEGDFNPRREAVFGRDENINRFCISPAMDALLQVEAEYPWVILPSKRQEWRAQFRILTEYQYTTYGPREPLEPQRPRYYPNMDVHHLLIMEWAHRLFGDAKYAADRDTMLQWLKDALYPQGAWTYIWPQNECYVYHQLNVTFLARYFEVTGDQRAQEILRRSRQFYPLMHDAEGMTESYTDCSWKHYWTAAAPNGADVIAGLFQDAANKRAALEASQRGVSGGLAAVYTAPWWKDLPPAPPHDNWLVHDENVQGPRGQFGTFSFAGTGRVTPPGEIGKDTFVGCLIGDRKGKQLPLEAALQVATIETRVNPEGTHWSNARYCSGHEKPSTIVTPDFATLCVRYRLTNPAWGHGSTDQPWEGVQQWFLCRDRLLGMLTLRALEDTTGAGVWGRLRFGMFKEFERGEEGLFKYGSLIVRLHDQNFARVETAPSETFFLDKPESFRSREILLKDAQAVSGAKPPFSYQAGQEFHFVAEVLPYWSDLAAGVRRLAAGSVLGFEFTQGGKHYSVLHNDTTKPATYAGHSALPQVQVFAPGGKPQMVPVKQGRYTVQIAADSQAVVVEP